MSPWLMLGFKFVKNHRMDSRNIKIIIKNEFLQLNHTVNVAFLIKCDSHKLR